MDESHLDILLVNSVDYTCQDEIVFGLMDVIKWYKTITDSINNLAYQQRIRTTIDINRDIQQ